jgi:vacuolar-type H+-ATPase subunit H
MNSMVSEAMREYQEGEGRERRDTALDTIADAEVRALQLLDDATIQADSHPTDEASEIIAEATKRARRMMSDAESRGDRYMAETYARAAESTAESIFSAAAVLCPDICCVGRHVHLSRHDFSLLETLVARNPTVNPSWIGERMGICPEAGKRFQVVGSSALSHDGLGWSR